MNTEGKDEENAEEIKPLNRQEKPMNQEMDEGLVLSEAAAKENKGIEEGKMKENNLNTTDTPDTNGLLLSSVGGIRNENTQKDRTNIITNSSMESTAEEEQEHRGNNNVLINEKAVITNNNNNNNTIVPLATKSVLDAFDNEKSSDDDDDDDNESIIANQYLQDADEYTVLFQLLPVLISSFPSWVYLDICCF